MANIVAHICLGQMLLPICRMAAVMDIPYCNIILKRSLVMLVQSMVVNANPSRLVR